MFHPGFTKLTEGDNVGSHTATIRRRRPMDQLTAEKLAIRETVDNWILWRDAGGWGRFKKVGDPQGWMKATWVHGPAGKIIEGSREGFNQGVNIPHFFGGF